jgi:hypothetical protein
LVLAVGGGLVAGDLVWENTWGAEVTVFGQPVTGYSRGWLLAGAAMLGGCRRLVAGGLGGATKGRRERRRELRRLWRNRRHHRSDSDAESTGVLDGKIDLATAIWPRGRTMPPPEPIWIVFVAIVLMGCVLLAVRAFRRRHR